MPIAKVRKPAHITARVKHDYFIHPIGQMASASTMLLLKALSLGDSDAEMTRLELGPRKRLPVWPLTIGAMWQVRQSTDFHVREHYLFYRRNPATGAVSLVPDSYFQGVRTNPVVKAARRAMAVIHAARTKPAAAKATAKC
jgi:hypothetical protein